MAVGYGTITLVAVMAAFSASSCGDDPDENNTGIGDGNNGGTTVPGEIPDTLARTPVSTPSVSLPLLTDPDGNAVLRHVVRSSVSGPVLPSGNYQNSGTATVERRVRGENYEALTAEDDGRYLIAPEDNELAYFRVINTATGGAIRVHHFHGVPAGHYMTFDTDSGDEVVATDNCRDVAVRVLSVPTERPDDHRLLVNGLQSSLPVYDDSRGYLRTASVCAIDQSGHYLATVVYDDGAGGIRYGFNFYQGIADGDTLEIDLSEEAGSVSWSASHDINEAYTLAARQPGWSRTVTLYTPPATDNESLGQSGTFPDFAALPVAGYRFTTTISDANSGSFSVQRDVALASTEVEWQINPLEFGGSSISVRESTWDNNGEGTPGVVSGVVYDGQRQTFAFMSMDPQVLSSNSIDFVLDDQLLLFNADEIGLTLAATTDQDNLEFASSAARQAGFRFWGFPAKNEANVDMASNPALLGNLSSLLVQAGD